MKRVFPRIRPISFPFCDPAAQNDLELRTSHFYLLRVPIQSICLCPIGSLGLLLFIFQLTKFVFLIATPFLTFPTDYHSKPLGKWAVLPLKFFSWLYLNSLVVLGTFSTFLEMFDINNSCKAGSDSSFAKRSATGVYVKGFKRKSYERVYCVTCSRRDM